MITLLRLELARTAADRRFLLLMLFWPVAMYLLFTNLFGATNARPSPGLDPNVAAMVSMAAFGAFGAALMATAPRIAQERAVGWFRQLRVLPLTPARVIAVKVVAAMVVALPAILLVDLTAVVDHGIALAAWQWLAIGALTWVGTAPFAALGVALGYLTDDASAFAISYGLYLALSAVGGLWMPVSMLPRVLQDIAPTLPSNRLAEFGWRIAAGHGPSLVGAAILAGWLLVFAGMAATVYRRGSAVR